MDGRYSDWLRTVVPSEATWRTKLSELRRIETSYGDLDEHYEADELESVLSELAYTSIDARNGEPNPSRLEINGDIRNNLASYKSALNKYIRFRQDVETEAAASLAMQPERDEEDRGNCEFSLEKDLQAALRAHIEQLEEGLTIIDDGVEMTVSSGRIDILAKDVSGKEVVIELKAVRAFPKALGQIAAYMGDRAAIAGVPVRGLIIAPDFDPKLVSAARVVPTLQLVRYSFSFSFKPMD